MAEKDTVFESKLKYGGFFSFSDFYQFCYDWLSDEIGLTVAEDSYVEKVKGDSKDIDIEWTCSKKFTDYFKFESKIAFKIIGLKKVEINSEGKKIKTNDGGIQIKVKGILVHDYQGKFESSGFQKFLRGIYEKWVIPGRVDEFEDKIAGSLDGFLSQAKSYLDLQGKR